MKQHITKEQARENPYAFHIIASMLGWSIEVVDGIIDRLPSRLVEEVNIGMMIEIIDKTNDKFLDIQRDGVLKEDKILKAWTVEVIKKTTQEGVYTEVITECELCDALWEATQLALKEDK